MGKATVNQILTLLRSDKIKDRQEAITSLEDYFRLDKTVLSWDTKGDGKAWIVVFQAVFEALAKERHTYLKNAKGSATALNRLASGVTLLRSLCERAVSRLNSKVTKPLLTHALTMMRHGRELIPKIALDYVKIIRCLFCWAPHLAHLRSDMWIFILTRAFNVVLGDDLKTDLDEGAELEREEDSEMAEDSMLEDDAAPSPSTENTAAKRKRQIISRTSTLAFRETASDRDRSLIEVQIEFTSIIAILLKSSSAPFHLPQYSYLPSAIFHRLARFISLYPGDTSLHHDYLLGVLAALSQLAVNNKDAVVSFAFNAWDGLIGLWGSKNKGIKEALVNVLKMVFPFLTAKQDPDSGRTSGGYARQVGQLWSLLDGESDTRWSMENLNLESVRFELSDNSRRGYRKPFVANTLRAGWHFGPGQALAWTTLELQADCIAKIFVLSESGQVGATTIRSQGKRARVERPITSLLQSISSTNTLGNLRAHRLRMLLFFIDRHWAILSETLQRDVVDALMQSISSEDAVVPSLVFACLAAIAYAQTELTKDQAAWDNAWTHAIRSANSPQNCRAACHCAHTLLLRSKWLLSSQRVSQEMRALIKDLDTQGPSMPHDSVCSLLRLCLDTTRRDVKLNRLHLEDVALRWLMDRWQSPVARRGTVKGMSAMATFTVDDVFALLQSICGLRKIGDLSTRTMLPDCISVDVSDEECRTEVVMDYLLHAQAPHFHDSIDFSGQASSTQELPTLQTDSTYQEATGRDRRISIFLLRLLETTLEELESVTETGSQVTAEEGRSMVDVAIIAMAFETALAVSQTHSSRRVFQIACKLLSKVVSILLHNRWSQEEQSFVILGIEPLAVSGNRTDNAAFEFMVSPDRLSGITKEVLRQLRSSLDAPGLRSLTTSRTLQRMIWQNADVQTGLANVMQALKNILSKLLGLDAGVSEAVDSDDQDDFAFPQSATPMRTQGQHLISPAARYGLEAVVTFLSAVPVLQSSTDEPSRDKGLVELFLECDDDHLVATGDTLLHSVKRGILTFNATQLDAFLQRFEELLLQHKFSWNESAQLLAVQFLDSTSRFWLQQPIMRSVTGKQALELCTWAVHRIRSQTAPSWRFRDQLARFLVEYLQDDPMELLWTPDGDDASSPVSILQSFGADSDIRVRMRAAVSSAWLLRVAYHRNPDPSDMYNGIRKFLCVDLSNYEHMLTRILCLGNVMVSSAAARRGPYWHLLETYFHSNRYSDHLDLVLLHVSRRLGFQRSRQLFEEYASQLAYSIRQARLDILRVPPSALGYSSLRECAEATFHAFTPTNLAAEGEDPEAIAHGQSLFLIHCSAIQKSPADGMFACFPDVVGYMAVAWFDQLEDNDESYDTLNHLLREKMAGLGNVELFEEYMTCYADAIATTILRALGEQNFSANGILVSTLQEEEPLSESAQVFRELSKYRRFEDFPFHVPNVPRFHPRVTLRALQWLAACVPDSNGLAASFHILRNLFNDIYRSALVNEQMRSVNAICLWVATHHTHFEDLVLLRTLMNGAVSLLLRNDLVTAAQSVLEWSFGICRQLDTSDAAFPDILIQTRCIAEDYCLAPEVDLKSTGRHLVQWIETQVALLCQSPAPRREIVKKAMPTWPGEPAGDLAFIYNEVALEDLAAMLKDTRATLGKFHVASRLACMPHKGSEYAASYFWRLKDCMPLATQLQDKDTQAFVSLLMRHSGRFGNLSTDMPTSHTLRARHRRAFRRKDVASNTLTVLTHQTIVDALVSIITSTEGRQSFMVYTALRPLLGTLSAEDGNFPSWKSEHHQDLEYLQQFTRAQPKRPLRSLDELSIWESVTASSTFLEWVCKLAALLCDVLALEDAFFLPLAPLLESDAALAEDMLPVLVHSILHVHRLKSDAANGKAKFTISQLFATFAGSESAHIGFVRTAVDVVLHLRNFPPPGLADAAAYDGWLTIDYLLLSRLAVTCGSYTTALLFLELANEYREPNAPEGIVDEQILFEIYSHIDEPDGFYGIQSKDMRGFLVKRLHHEKEWGLAFRLHGAGLEADRTDAGEREGMLQSLYAFGFDRFAMQALQDSADDGILASHQADMGYHLGWRTESWDLPDLGSDADRGRSLYLAMRAVYCERDQHIVYGIVRHAFKTEMEALRAVGDENVLEMQVIVRNLLCLQQIVDLRNDQIQPNVAFDSEAELRVFSTFCDIAPTFEFAPLETIMATRMALLRSARQKEEREQIGALSTSVISELLGIEKKCLLRVSEAARASNNLQVALNSVTRAQRLEQEPGSLVLEEFSQVLWLLKEPKLAIQSLKNLLSGERRRSGMDPVQEAMLLSRLGSWTAEAGLQKPSAIVEEFFSPAAALLTGAGLPQGSGESSADVFRQFAVFAERQYVAILRSPDSLRFQVYVDRKRKEIERLGEEISKLPAGGDPVKLVGEKAKASAVLKKDQKTWREHTGARETFLTQAVDMFSRALEAGDVFDDECAMRLCSLWFSNFEEESVQLAIATAVNRVASHKFTFLAHQLTARLSKTEGDSASQTQTTLYALVLRMAEEHPYHTLYQVSCLRPANDVLGLGKGRRQSSRLEPPSPATSREAAANDLFARLKADKKNKSAPGVEMICAASLEWATFPIKGQSQFKNKSSSTLHQIPEQLRIKHLKDVPVPVTTALTRIDPTKRYKRCVWVHSYLPTFQTAGGVNLPKISVCLGSNKKEYKQLFKGEGGDDLRQDAVMEQVFELVNGVLRRDGETRRRNLAIRSYKVIPLFPKAGLLEFVGDTTPISSWLGPAHIRYRPDDIKPNEFTHVMRQKREERKDAEYLCKTFIELRKRFHPVMRHYFTEQHKTPMAWFRTRLNYTRSVATTSIVGHLLGLGDRHISNILLDTKNGEVIHIDLGIAFEQGKNLPIPERVPFRMTADMVDGMGMSGTQGVFQRCAEETLRVLRDGSETIMTVLEVFKHDPLHDWTVSSSKAARIQGTSEPAHMPTLKNIIGIDMLSDNAHELADRALSTVSRKLDKALSVEYVVNELIAEATDPFNLANMFTGWSIHM